MKKIVFSLVALTSLLFSEAIDRTGPYIALGGGYATFYDDGRLGSSEIDSSYNVNLIGGAFINKYLSVELGLDYYDTFKNVAGDTTNIYMVEAIAKAHYPVWKDRIDFYGAFGAGGMWWKETLLGVSQDDKSGVVSGDLGFGLRALDWLTLNLGYRRYFFTLEHQLQTTNLTEASFIHYNMEVSTVYTNIEVQF